MTEKAEIHDTVYLEMIELCTKKRMLIGITLLGGLVLFYSSLSIAVNINIPLVWLL